MKILGLGNALVDILSGLKSDNLLVEIGIQKGAMDMISNDIIPQFVSNDKLLQQDSL